MLALLAMPWLASCALVPPEPGGVIAVADIINSIKCGLGDAAENPAARARLNKAIATVQLDLKVADTRQVGANTPATTGPVVLPWYGPLVLPTIAGSNQQSFAVDTTLEFSYKLDSPGESCNAAGVNRYDQFGFARWLSDVIAGLSKVSARGPKGSLDKLTYDATFAVTRAGTLGGTVQVVFLSAGVSASSNRADTQHLKIVITTPNSAVVEKAADAGTATRALTPREIATIPRLSQTPPAAR